MHDFYCIVPNYISLNDLVYVTKSILPFQLNFIRKTCVPINFVESWLVM